MDIKAIEAVEPYRISLEAEEDRLSHQADPVSSELSKTGLATIMLRRFELSKVFNEFLELLAVRLADLPRTHPLRKALEENLAEELGSSAGYGSFIHENSRAALVEALGEDYESWKNSPAHETAQQFMDGYRQLLMTAPVLTAYAAMMYWEWRISRKNGGDYPIFLTRFETIYPEWKQEAYVPGDVLWHLHSHAQEDDHHAQNFKHALEASTTGENEADVSRGIEQAARLWDQFWTLNSSL